MYRARGRSRYPAARCQVADFATAAAKVLAAGGLGATRINGDVLARARAAAWDQVVGLGSALATGDGMEALRAARAHLHSTGDDAADAIAAIGAAPVFVAAWNRRRIGLEPVAPSPALSHAADYLRMTLGVTPSDEAARAVDAYLVTVIDHGMNASTFTARVVTSTGSDLISAVVAAVGALKGPLHGGAPGPVLDMLDAIGEPARAETWLLNELAAGRRIMGMGHRIYRVRDPRAAVLEQAVKPLAYVEFYTAVLLDAAGLPREQFSATFAVGRIAGWAAHVLEQRRVGRLIRPASRYVGPIPKLAHEPSEQHEPERSGAGDHSRTNPSERITAHALEAHVAAREPQLVSQRLGEDSDRVGRTNLDDRAAVTTTHGMQCSVRGVDELQVRHCGVDPAIDRTERAFDFDRRLADRLWIGQVARDRERRW